MSPKCDLYWNTALTAAAAKINPPMQRSLGMGSPSGATPQPGWDRPSTTA